MSATVKVTVEIPFHLQTLAQAGPLVELEVGANATQRELIAALERRHPPLSGAVVDPHSHKRRPLLRFFACQEDISHVPLDTPLPAAVLEGREVFMIVGAISGG